MKSILDLFKKKEAKSDKVSDFFYRASKEEKKAVFLEVAKEASADQRELLKKYDEQLSHG
jgi:TRAP-type C4-dicarboxylate transport system substrate-binding protein